MGENVWRRGTESGMTESRDTGREQGDVRGRETGKWGKQMRSCWFKGMRGRAAIEAKQKCVGKRSAQKRRLKKSNSKKNREQMYLEGILGSDGNRQ